MKKNTLLAAAIFACSMAYAQTDTTTQTLNEVVVTANKFPQKQSTTGKVVTVINSLQIQRSVGKDLAQVLTEQSGITVNGAYSNPGKDKSVYMRGASGNYTLFLLDGVPLNDPSGIGGSFDIRLIPIESVERIEILKGSQSTLYGANAIAGVINIITKKGTSETTTGSALAAYGSYNTFKGTANVARRGKVFEYNIGYEHYNTDGITEAKDTTGNANFDKDGFNRQTLSAHLGFNVTDKIKLLPYYRFSQFRGGYDEGAFIDGTQKYNASLINTGLISKLDYNKGAVTANYGYDYTKRDYNGYALAGRFHHAEAFVNHNFNSIVSLLAGTNYQSYAIPAMDKKSTIISPYASLFFKFSNGFNVEAGGRINKHNQYGVNYAYSINPSYLINDAVKLFANVSTGFRTPSVNELFGLFGANPALEPESAKTWEGGVQAWLLDKKLSALATLYKRNVKNIIIYGARGYENRDLQKDGGLELELAYQPNNNLNLKATYTFIDGEITQKLAGKDTTFYNLLRRPKHTVNLFAGYQLNDNFFISTNVQSVSKRIDTYYDPVTYAASSKTLAAYALWNAYAEYKLTKNSFKVFADVKNITNKKNYAEVYGYNVQGFNLMAGVRFAL